MRLWKIFIGYKQNNGIMKGRKFIIGKSEEALTNAMVKMLMNGYDLERLVIMADKKTLDDMHPVLSPYCKHRELISWDGVPFQAFKSFRNTKIDKVVEEILT